MTVRTARRMGLWAGAAFAAAVVSSAAGAAEPAAKPDGLNIVRKVVEGRLVHAGKRAISVEYDTTSEGSFEMSLPLAEGVEVRGAASVADLKYGDKVKVGIEQSFRPGDDGAPVLVKTEALVIVLLEPAQAATATP